MQICSNVKVQQGRVPLEIQRMVGVSGLQGRAGSEPVGPHGGTVGGKVPHAVHQVVPLFNDVSPGGPDGGMLREGEQVPEGLPVFRVKGGIAHRLHIIGPGGPLGVDVEHQKAVVSVGKGDALHRLQRGVQGIRRGGGGVDAHADQGMLSPGPQDVPVF